MKIENLSSVIDDVKAAISVESDGAMDLAAMTTQISGAVTEFLSEGSLTDRGLENEETAVVSVESLGAQIPTLGAEPIMALLEKADIKPEHKAAAVDSVFNVLAKHADVGSVNIWRNQSASCESFNPGATPADFSELVGIDASNAINAEDGLSISKESFGVDVDKATPDLRLDITIALLRFHSDLTLAMLPMKTTNEPVVRYKRLNAEVYDLIDTDAKPVQIVELYKNGAQVENVQRPINVLLANVVDGEVIADEILAAGKAANILELSIDATKPGYAHINHTDLVAEGAELDSVYFVINDGTNPDETFLVDLPKQEFRFTRSNDNDDVAERVMNKSYSVFLTSSSVQASGAPSLTLAACPNTNEGIRIELYISGKLNLKTGETIVTVTASVVAAGINGATPSAAITTIVTNIKAGTLNGTAYKIAAKFAEDNMRKASLAGRSSVQTMFYEIKPGRTYQWDYALGEQSTQQNISILGNMLRIGQGYRTLTTVEDTLTYVADANARVDSGALEAKYGPSHKFAAGSRVNPRVINTTLDFAPLVSNNDMHQAENIRQRALIFLNAIVSQLAAESFIRQQVTGSALHYRVVTSNEILDNVLSQNYGPDHTVMQQENKGSVEHTVVLPCGAYLDIVTTTEESFSRKMMLYLVFEPADSELNFGQNHNYGQLSGHYPVSGPGRANLNRLYTSTRETVIPTNPTGAIIDVVNLDQMLFRP